MSLDEGFEDFYDEFKEWTKKQILHRTYDICLENADKDKEIERLNNIIYREISNYILKKYGMLDDTHYHDFLNELELK